MKKVLYYLTSVCFLFLFACRPMPKEQQEQPQVQAVEEQTDTIKPALDTADSLATTSNPVESRRIIYDEKGRMIYLAVDSFHVLCYTQIGDNPPRKLDFRIGEDYEGFPIMYIHRYGNNVFLVGDLIPNSNGWTSRFSVYKINGETFGMAFVANGAAVHFDKDGFKVAQCRLTNPDADCTANEIWVMHDSYYNINGKKVREDKTEYDFETMEKEYGDSLVNAQKMSI